MGGPQHLTVLVGPYWKLLEGNIYAGDNLTLAKSLDIHFVTNAPWANGTRS